MNCCSTKYFERRSGIRSQDGREVILRTSSRCSKNPNRSAIGGFNQRSVLCEEGGGGGLAVRQARGERDFEAVKERGLETLRNSNFTLFGTQTRESRKDTVQETSMYRVLLIAFDINFLRKSTTDTLQWLLNNKSF